MTRLTGFIAFACIVIVAIVLIIQARPDPFPEPHASCLQAHRDRPQHTLGPLGRTDVLFVEERSRVESLEDHEGERITTHVRPAARSAGEPLDLVCYRDADVGDMRLPP